MTALLARSLLALACVSLGTQAIAGDAIQYYECRADNDATTSIFALDDTTRKVCDRTSQDKWIEPSEYNSGKVVWDDFMSTKTIYRQGKNRGYEHDVLVFVHTGRCSRLRTRPAQTCKD